MKIEPRTNKYSDKTYPGEKNRGSLRWVLEESPNIFILSHDDPWHEKGPTPFVKVLHIIGACNLTERLQDEDGVYTKGEAILPLQG